jgi:hypothetical protein
MFAQIAKAVTGDRLIGKASNFLLLHVNVPKPNKNNKTF